MALSVLLVDAGALLVEVEDYGLSEQRSALLSPRQPVKYFVLTLRELGLRMCF